MYGLEATVTIQGGLLFVFWDLRGVRWVFSPHVCSGPSSLDVPSLIIPERLKPWVCLQVGHVQMPGVNDCTLKSDFLGSAL